VRHRRTVWRSQRISAASRRLDGWSEAAARTISRQRNARAWGVACARASVSNCVRSSSAKVTGGAYGTGIGAILISCQVKQRWVLFENDRNSQSCPDKRLGRDLRNGHLGCALPCRSRPPSACGGVPSHGHAAHRLAAGPWPGGPVPRVSCGLPSAPPARAGLARAGMRLALLRAQVEHAPRGAGRTICPRPPWCSLRTSPARRGHGENGVWEEAVFSIVQERLFCGAYVNVRRLTAHPWTRPAWSARRAHARGSMPRRSHRRDPVIRPGKFSRLFIPGVAYPFVCDWSLSMRSRLVLCLDADDRSLRSSEHDT
jgi:hypothetical protein